MPLLQVSGVPAGPPSTITHPLNGRPVAEVTLGVTTAPWSPGEQVSLSFDTENPPPDYLMTVVRVGMRGGFVSAQLIGGTGGLGKDLEAKFYTDIPAETVVREILHECGEAVGELSLPRTLPHWVRRAGPAHEALQAVMMGFPERIWWMDAAGKVHADAPKWSEFETELPLESYDAAQGLYTVPLTPGLTANRHITMTRGEERVEKRATRVSHVIDTVYARPKDQTRLRTLIQVGDGKDQGPNGLHHTVRQTMRHTDYHSLRPATIIRDHGNHTVDLEVLEAGWPPMTRVPLHVPLPGVRVKVKAGSPALLMFEQGDPAQPVAECRSTATLEYIEARTGQGHKLTLDDDRGQVSPEEAQYLKPFVRLEDMAGQKVELWAQKGKERVTVQDKAGQKLELNPVKKEVSVNHVSGSAFTMLGSGDVLLHSVGSLLLGDAGGQPVARQGDRVQVDPVTHAGTIVSGSLKVRSS